MPLVTSTEMFKKAYEGHYAVGAFNVNNMEIIQGIVSKQPLKTPACPSACTLTTAKILKSAKPALTAALPPL